MDMEQIEKNLICIFNFQLFDCRNHIRVIQSMDNGNRLYICGTNAHNPKDYVIYVSTYKKSYLEKSLKRNFLINFMGF